MAHTHTHTVRDNPGQLTGVIMLSAAIGALVAMMFTPKRGQEMRASAKGKARTMVDTMKRNKGKFPHSMQNAADKLADTASDASDRAKSTAAKVKDDTKSTAKKVARDTKATTRNTKDATEEIRRNGEP